MLTLDPILPTPDFLTFVTADPPPLIAAEPHHVLEHRSVNMKSELDATQQGRLEDQAIAENLSSALNDTQSELMVQQNDTESILIVMTSTVTSTTVSSTTSAFDSSTDFPQSPSPITDSPRDIADQSTTSTYKLSSHVTITVEANAPCLLNKDRLDRDVVEQLHKDDARLKAAIRKLNRKMHSHCVRDYQFITIYPKCKLWNDEKFVYLFQMMRIHYCDDVQMWPALVR
jgi:hypothetical protein